jgi:hypothetical protein
MPTLSPSLRRMIGNIDARWPHRDRRTDGWLRWPSQGRSIGHNPAYLGYVHAYDLDRDGVDPYWIINNVYKGGRVLWYIIYNRQYWSNTYGWRAKPYTLSNPHTDHLHIEIYQTNTARFYSGPWFPGGQGIGAAAGAAAAVAVPSIIATVTGWDYRGAVDGSAVGFEGMAQNCSQSAAWINGI